MADEFEQKKLLADFFLRMRDEQIASARHHETQRSSVTTIFTSLAVAILALILALAQRSGFALTLLPITLGLIVLGFAGLIIIVKLFERSMSHFSLAEAYLDSLHVLLRDESERCFKGRVESIGYVEQTAGTREQQAGRGDVRNFIPGWRSRTTGCYT